MYRVFFIAEDGYRLNTKNFDTLLQATTFANEQKQLVIQIQHINKAVKKEHRT
jgi:hypothetical protein